jgi:hypothetical protein
VTLALRLVPRVRRSSFCRNFRATARAAGLLFLLAAAAPPQRSVAEVFRNFEAICMTDLMSGYSLDVKLIIEKADFEFQRNERGYDVYNSDLGQLIIAEKSCSMGMPGLPFDMMLDLTRPWAERRGFTMSGQSKSTSGGRRWEWKNGTIGLALEENNFPNGIPLTGLVSWRE